MTPCTHLRTEPAAQATFASPSAREIQPAIGCTSFKRLPRFGTGEWQDWPSWSIAWGSVGGTENAPGESGAHHVVVSDFSFACVLQFSCAPMPPNQNAKPLNLGPISGLQCRQGPGASSTWPRQHHTLNTRTNQRSTPVTHLRSTRGRSYSLRARPRNRARRCEKERFRGASAAQKPDTQGNFSSQELIFVAQTARGRFRTIRRTEPKGSQRAPPSPLCLIRDQILKSAAFQPK